MENLVCTLKKKKKNCEKIQKKKKKKNPKNDFFDGAEKNFQLDWRSFSTQTRNFNGI